MEGFLSSFNPLFQRYKSELVLLGCALLIGILSGALFLYQKQNEKIPPTVSEKTNTRTIPPKKTITVDVSGAVTNPFVYSFTPQERIIDAIQKAGGLREDADKAFMIRNVNLARILGDQEKIYIPFLSDTAEGYVLENKRIIDYTQPITSANQDEVAQRVNINVASAIELDQLPGIGKVQSEAILNGRPYAAPDDLVRNNIIKQSVYEKIKDQISVY